MIALFRLSLVVNTCNQPEHLARELATAARQDQHLAA
jgi:hypothetical protein